MNKFVIEKYSAEIRTTDLTSICYGVSSSLDQDPETVKSFKSKEDAIAALAAYESDVTAYESNGLVMVTEYAVCEYSDDDLTVWQFSSLPKIVHAFGTAWLLDGDRYTNGVETRADEISGLLRGWIDAIESLTDDAEEAISAASEALESLAAYSYGYGATYMDFDSIPDAIEEGEKISKLCRSLEDLYEDDLAAELVDRIDNAIDALETIRGAFKKPLSIPERIRAARQAKGYTQRQLGELMGYEGRTGETTVQRWESGSRPVPIEKIRALAATLGLTLDDLIP